MNLHKKLTNLGFKRCEFMRPQSSRSRYGIMEMVPDLDEEKFVFDRGWKKIIIPKNHPKSNSFYRLNFSPITTIWISVKGQTQLIVYVESSSIKEGVKTVYDYSNDKHSKIPIESKSDIVKLLPREVQRELTLNSLFE